MNRRTKIIVSVAGIFVVLLALLGLTYAYFLTRINGNTNNKSISVTTANLRLDYGEETSAIVSKSNIQPGEAILTKKFSATNNGTREVEYAVVFENIVNTFTRKEDVVYTLTCTSSNGTSCNGVTEETTFPSSEKAIIVGNKIATGVTHNYTLTVEYKEMNVDQSIDMGKSLSAKVNIADPNSLNPYVSNKKLLAYNIINNAAINKNGTELRSTTLTVPAQETSEKYKGKVSIIDYTNSLFLYGSEESRYWTYGTGYKIDTYTGKFTLTGVSTCKYNEGNCASKIKENYVVSTSASGNSNSTNTLVTTTNLNNIYKVEAFETGGLKKISSVKESAESTMSFATDDWGTSYYYRGDVEDNYLELNNMCFRIVRIQGDGSIKLTLAKEGKCNTITNTDTKSALINNGATDTVYGYTEEIIYNINIPHFNYEGYTGTNGLYKALNDWYTTNLKSVEGKLKNETWCLGGKTSKYNYNTGELLDYSPSIDSVYNYETGNRLWGPYDWGDSIFDHTKRSATYMCSSEADKVTGYIGSLTADEVVFAGGLVVNYKDNTAFEEIPKNKTYYLYDNAQTDYWTLSRSVCNYGYDNAFNVRSDGSVDDANVDGTYAVRPTVTIATGAEILSGDGTIGNPYTIKLD